MHDDPLDVILRALCAAMHPTDPLFMVVGGYGLVLRARHGISVSRSAGSSGGLRSTSDLDVLLSLDLLASPSASDRLATAIRDLGFEEHTAHMRFHRGRTAHSPPLGIDLMAPKPHDGRYGRLRSDSSRIRSAKRHTIHGRATEGAHLVLGAPHRIRLPNDSGAVHVPHLFGYLILKALAYRDTLVERRDQAPKHAADLFILLATASANEFDETMDMVRSSLHEASVREARRILQESFVHAPAEGLSDGRRELRRGGVLLSAAEESQAIQAMSYLAREL